MKTMHCLVYLLVFMAIVLTKQAAFILPRVAKSSNPRFCSVYELEEYDNLKQCSASLPHSQITGVVSEGAVCSIWDSETETEDKKMCVAGLWRSQPFMANGQRVKIRTRRGWFIAAALFAVVGVVVCTFFCSSDDSQPPPNNPPKIQCPSIPANFIAGPMEETVQVTWDDPTYSDPNGDTVIVTQTGGSPKNTKFSRGSYSIQYKATDDKGASSTCMFGFTVEVKTCPTPEHPSNGKINCNHQSYIYGTACTYECNVGYSLSHTTPRICQSSETFDGTKPTCESITCLVLPSPDNGRITCSNGFLYQSTCTTECDDGYDAGDVKYTRCKADRTWTRAVAPCKDNQAPRFTQCPVSVKSYAGRNSSSVVVSWESPTATDNHDPTVTVQQTQGQPSGSNFEVGVHQQKYTAKDSSGNESPPCQFNVVVEELFCDYPDTVFNDTFLHTRCNNGHRFGSECELLCSDNYQLLGTVTTISCERNGTSNIVKWDWGSGPEPRCNSDICPDLTPPINGALACNRVGVNKYCTMSCNEEYDIPTTVDTKSYIVCTNEGVWIPFSDVPDCTERRNPKRSRLPGEYYYFSGDCADVNVQNQIKETFITIANSQQGVVICPPSTCSIDSINVKCGEKQSRRRKREYRPNRRKRSGQFVVLSFEISLAWQNTDNSSLKEMQYNEHKLSEIWDKLMPYADDVVANSSGVTYASAFKDWSDVECDVGTTAVWSSTGVACSGCPTGTMYNSTKDDCSVCPRGTYQDEAFQDRCIPCPSGTYTAKEGSKNKTQCIEKCKPGYYSPETGLEPCLPCEKGTYQSVSMATKCVQCSSVKTTKSRGSDTESDCTEFDVAYNERKYDIPLKFIQQNITSFTLGFWMSCPIDNGVYPVFKLGNTDSANLGITGSNPPQVTILGKSVNVPKGPLSWNHLVLRFNAITKTVTVFVNSIYNDHTLNVGSTTVAQVGDYMRIHVSHNVSSDQKSSECTMSGFFLVNRMLENTDVFGISRTCYPDLSDAIYKMGDFKPFHNADSGIQISTPSLCDGVDECESSPCGAHKCENLLNGYRCVCIKGYTGKQCAVPPDYCLHHECQNGATCKTQTWNYTCECAPGYRGHICEETIVNGHWSHWSLWGACSVTCGGGTRVRTRSCTNPPPDSDGSDCAGDSVETQICNSAECKKCPSPSTIRSTLTRIKCTSTGSYHSCEASCRPGNVWLHEPQNPYHCGDNTSHVWQPAPKVPECTVVKGPSIMTLQSELPIQGLTCTEASENAVLNSVNVSSCDNTEACKYSVQITGCSSRRKRRSTSTATINFSIKLEEGDNLDLAGYLENGTMSQGFKDYIDAITVLETTAQQLNKSFSDVHNITVNGVDYVIDSSTLTMTGNLNCSAGSVANGGACIECTPGTKQDGKWCVWCEMGTYQDSFGQTECVECPGGNTTLYLGSSNLTDCSAPLTVVSSTEQSTAGQTASDTTVVTTEQSTAGQTTSETTVVTTEQSNAGQTASDTTVVTTEQSTAGQTTSETTVVTTEQSTAGQTTSDTTVVTTEQSTAGQTTSETTVVTTEQSTAGQTTSETTVVTTEQSTAGQTTSDTTVVTTEQSTAGQTTSDTTLMATEQSTAGQTTSETTVVTTEQSTAGQTTSETTVVTTEQSTAGQTTSETTVVTTEQSTAGQTTSDTTVVTTKQSTAGQTTSETTVVTSEQSTAGQTTSETTVVTSEQSTAGQTTSDTTVVTTEQSTAGQTTSETTVVTTEQSTAGQTTSDTTGVTTEQSTVGQTTSETTVVTTKQSTAGQTTSETTVVTTEQSTIGQTSLDTTVVSFEMSTAGQTISETTFMTAEYTTFGQSLLNTTDKDLFVVIAITTMVGLVGIILFAVFVIKCRKSLR